MTRKIISVCLNCLPKLSVCAISRPILGRFPALESPINLYRNIWISPCWKLYPLEHLICLKNWTSKIIPGPAWKVLMWKSGWTFWRGGIANACVLTKPLHTSIFWRKSSSNSSSHWPCIFFGFFGPGCWCRWVITGGANLQALFLKKFRSFAWPFSTLFRWRWKSRWIWGPSPLKSELFIAFPLWRPPKFCFRFLGAYFFVSGKNSAAPFKNRSLSAPRTRFPLTPPPKMAIIPYTREVTAAPIFCVFSSFLLGCKLFFGSC